MNADGNFAVDTEDEWFSRNTQPDLLFAETGYTGEQLSEEYSRLKKDLGKVQSMLDLCQHVWPLDVLSQAISYAYVSARQLDEDYSKSGQNKTIEEFAGSYVQAGQLFMRLCLNKLKDEGDDTFEDLCTALLPTDVGVGYAKHHIHESVDGSDSEGPSSESTVKGSRKSVTDNKRARKNKTTAQDSISRAADALRSDIENRQKLSQSNGKATEWATVFAEYSQAVGKHVETLMKLMAAKEAATTEEAKEFYDGLIVKIEVIMAEGKRRINEE